MRTRRGDGGRYLPVDERGDGDGCVDAAVVVFDFGG